MSGFKKILLYGDSLWLSGLAAYLQHIQGVMVFQAHLPGAGAPQDNATVDLVILDRAQEMHAVSLLRAYPMAVVMSVDPSASTSTVVRGHSQPVRTLQEIECLVREVVNGLSTQSREQRP